MVLVDFSESSFDLNLKSKVFIIAEIGQNHQGSMDVAKKLISVAKNCGCDCVKFQKSNLSEKFTKSALERAYKNDNSFGETYGDHKKFLEFSIEQFQELKVFADQKKILFSSSAMDETSFDELVTMDLPFIKIGSGDANNFPLLIKAAKHMTPLVISTGMQNNETIKKIVNIMRENRKENFALLHCISSYPTIPENVFLNNIKILKNKFPTITIGYSGHEEGILISQAAALFGAKIIERHITLDKNQKGSDHKCSLEPNELKKLIDGIRKFEKTKILGENKTTNEIIEILKQYEISEIDEKNLLLAFIDVSVRTILDCEMVCKKKLGKSLIYSKDYSAGYQLQFEDILIKVSEPYCTAAERIHEFVGKILKVDVYEDGNLKEQDFEIIHHAIE